MLPVMLWHKLPRDEAHEEGDCRKGAKMQVHGVSEGVSAPMLVDLDLDHHQDVEAVRPTGGAPREVPQGFKILGAHPNMYLGSPAQLDGMGSEPPRDHSHQAGGQAIPATPV